MNSITPEQNKKLLALLSEAKARGIALPSDIRLPDVIEDKWNVDENGYFIARSGKRFNPRPELEDFINGTARFSLLRSGRGGSKTTSGAQKAMRKISQGKSGGVMSPDFENFRSSTWVELREWIPWQMVVPKQRYRRSDSWEAIRPFTMVFVNGAKMYCKGLKDPESARGGNWNWFWYDEGRRDPTGLGWRNAISAVRVGENPQAWCTTTPAHSQHWTSTFFSGELTPELIKLLEDLGISRTQELFAIFETSIERNKPNLDPMFYASILATYPKGYLRAREVEGKVADEQESIGDRTWFKDKVLNETPDWISQQVRFWDLAGTEDKMVAGKKKNDPDETMGSLVGMDKEANNFCLQDQMGGRWKWETIKDMVVAIARQDGQEVKVCFEQEPASGGKNQVAELINHIKSQLPEWDVSGLESRKLGDRVLAANTWFGEAAKGQWWMVEGLWNNEFLNQLDFFPNKAMHDDRITSVTGARHKIAPIRKWRKINFLHMAMDFNNKKNEKETLSQTT